MTRCLFVDNVCARPDNIRASTALTQALLVLLNAVERLPLPYPIVRRDNVAQQLVMEFVRRLKEVMESIGRPASWQAQWDLVFMQQLLRTFSGDANGVVIDTTQKSTVRVLPWFFLHRAKSAT